MVDFSKYNVVFCDSKEAINWAYSQGLPKDSIIKMSSPAMLWDKNDSIQHIEARWTLAEMREFQTGIKKFSEDVYDSIINVDGVTHEIALCIAHASVKFNKILFKAACLKKEDLFEKRLFIKVEGVGGLTGNNMNSPWDDLLKNCTSYSSISYKLKEDIWNVSSKKDIPLWNRIRLGGVETLIYRVVDSVLAKIPRRLFSKKIIVPSENELLIESLYYLLTKGIAVQKIKPDKNAKIEYRDFSYIRKFTSPIIKKRLQRWVVPDLVSRCLELYFNLIYKDLRLMDKYSNQWRPVLNEIYGTKKALFINVPCNPKGLSLTELCRKQKIPILSAQHGVSREICSMHDAVSTIYEINASDYFFTYNTSAAKISEDSHFAIGKAFTVGMSKRHIRVGNRNFNYKRGTIPIMFISTNIYRGNLGNFASWLTDYERSINEGRLISEIFSKIPHKVCYKTYPEDDRRYCDKDPVLCSIKEYKNIEVYDKKVDMRYLLQDYRILITTGATSTVSWAVMSGKPVIFINYKNHSSLTTEAYNSFSKGLFLFDADSENFSEDLKVFLSKPIEEIESLWIEKKLDNEVMIKKFFSNNLNGGGKKVSEIVMNNLFK
jgi:hypothetical protein